MISNYFSSIFYPLDDNKIYPFSDCEVEPPIISKILSSNLISLQFLKSGNLNSSGLPSRVKVGVSSLSYGQK